MKTKSILFENHSESQVFQDWFVSLKQNMWKDHRVFVNLFGLLTGNKNYIIQSASPHRQPCQAFSPQTPLRPGVLLVHEMWMKDRVSVHWSPEEGEKDISIHVCVCVYIIIYIYIYIYIHKWLRNTLTMVLPWHLCFKPCCSDQVAFHSVVSTILNHCVCVCFF